MSGDAVMDPLKMHTAGVKKPMQEKEEKIQNLYNNQERYYPTDPKGNLDEWGAVIKRQTEAYQRDVQAQQVQKELNRQSYNQELTKAVQLKREQENLERAYRAGERDQMLRAVDYKQMQDRN